MHSTADTAWIAERAKSLGFDRCGIVRAEKLPDLQEFREWLACGYAGEMHYLAEELERGELDLVCGKRRHFGHPLQDQNHYQS